TLVPLSLTKDFFLTRPVGFIGSATSNHILKLKSMHYLHNFFKFFDYLFISRRRFYFFLFLSSHPDHSKINVFRNSHIPAKALKCISALIRRRWVWRCHPHSK